MNLVDKIKIVADAVREVMNESDNYESKCIIHAVLTKALLKKMFNIDSKLQAGSAGWNLGKRGWENVCHGRCLDGEAVCIVESYKTWDGHAWVEVDGMILDTTAYSLNSKYHKLNAAESIFSPLKGKHKFGDYIWIHPSKTKSLTAWKSKTKINDCCYVAHNEDVALVVTEGERIANTDGFDDKIKQIAMRAIMSEYYETTNG